MPLASMTGLLTQSPVWVRCARMVEQWEYESRLYDQLFFLIAPGSRFIFGWQMVHTTYPATNQTLYLQSHWSLAAAISQCFARQVLAVIPAVAKYSRRWLTILLLPCLDLAWSFLHRHHSLRLPVLSGSFLQAVQVHMMLVASWALKRGVLTARRSWQCFRNLVIISLIQIIPRAVKSYEFTSPSPLLFVSMSFLEVADTTRKLIASGTYWRFTWCLHCAKLSNSSQMRSSSCEEILIPDNNLFVTLLIQVQHFKSPGYWLSCSKCLFVDFLQPPPNKTTSTENLPNAWDNFGTIHFYL